MLGVPPQEALAQAAGMTRDKNRTPMQWSNAANGGFCPAAVSPWLPVNPNYARGVNVSDQEKDPSSLLSFYRTLLRLRRQSPALIAGDYQALHEQSEDYLAFLRRARSGDKAQTCLVVLNYSANAQRLDLTQAGTAARLLYTNAARSQQAISLNEVQLAPFEILIMDVT
jgi:glycosidase